MSDEMTAVIFDVQRFCIQDGPGIRTTVFFKGCPLRCLWCHNPESLSERQNFSYRADKCSNCGACRNACTYGVHSWKDEVHYVDFAKCVRCGACVEVCCYDALSLTGRKVTVSDIMREIETDISYYESDGGVTLSGGEPMQQPDFVKELSMRIKERGINLCMETCGYTAPANFRAVAPFIDTFLFDYKATDPDEHKRLTGVSNGLILSNLKLLNSLGRPIVLRCPLIPGINDTDQHLQGIADTKTTYEQITRVELLPYHMMGESKRLQMGIEKSLPDVHHATEQQKRYWLEYLKKHDCQAEIVK